MATAVENLREALRLLASFSETNRRDMPPWDELRLLSLRLRVAEYLLGIAGRGNQHGERVIELADFVRDTFPNWSPDSEEAERLLRAFAAESF